MDLHNYDDHHTHEHDHADGEDHGHTHGGGIKQALKDDWEKTKADFKDDWEQTKNEVPGLHGSNQDQEADGTVQQAVGKE